MSGRTIAVYGDTGTGKTTQLGEVAKARFKSTGLRTRLNTSDRGGFGPILPHIKVGIIVPNVLAEADDPWVWLDACTSSCPDEFGIDAYDSATSLGEGILTWIKNSPQKIGQQNTQRFKVGGKAELQIGLNNESHYGIVQGFLLEQMWRSTWLTTKGSTPDVIWTFGLDRDEKADKTLVVGPKVAGHALTAHIPKWFNYTFRLVSVPVPGDSARHLLYTQEQPDLNGMGVSFGNPRYPLDAATPLPAVIEPASIVEALRLIEQGQEEAENNLRMELGL